MAKTPRKAKAAAPDAEPIAAPAPLPAPQIDLLGATPELWDLDDLYPYNRNSRVHSAEQKTALAAAMRKYGWTMPILAREDGGIIAGHARWEVATELLKLKQGPVIVARGWSEDMIRAYVIWDNRSAEMATWDLPALRQEVGELESIGYDLGLVGFDLPALDALDPPPGAGDDGGSTYSRKVDAPIYTPKGETYRAVDLFDDTKARELRRQIDAANLPADVRDFLDVAADRHVVFNFHRIAEFYASADAPIQRLMEKSALVIVDFDKAIENGFVALSDRLGALASTMPNASLTDEG